MISIQRGHVAIYRQYDVADAIDLEAAAQTVQRGETRRLALRRLPKAQLQILAPPLSFELGQQRVTIDHREFAIDGSARVYDFGTISVVLRVLIPVGTSLEALAQQNTLFNEHPALDSLAKELLLRVFDELKPAMKGAHLSGFSEDYTITCVQQFDTAIDVAQLAREPWLARLLLAEVSNRAISTDAIDDAMSVSFSYYADELAVIDWNSAFVFDPTGDNDIPDLIEFASAQLLELRYYDDVLDRELSRMYAEIGRVRGFFKKQKYQTLSRHLMQLVLDVTEVTEKIDNSLKWVGDIYLARCYQGAAKQFALSRWQAQVERKLSLAARATELVTNQITTDRTLLLETSVVLLIVFEVLLALWRH